MSEERRKINKQSTGTVPKTKCRDNTVPFPNERDNNSASDLYGSNLLEYLRNSRRGNHINGAMEEPTRHLNGSLTPGSSASRRDSSGTVPKCDNVTKYPDKRHIEDKLSQIREYLQITTTLMAGMKNNDEQLEDGLERNDLVQMVRDLKDSEAKLVDILQHMEETAGRTVEIVEINDQATENGLDSYSEGGLSTSEDPTHREIEMLRDQQMTLLSMQQKAENRLRDARQIQDKLMMAQFGNDLSSGPNQKNFASVDDAIRELEERTKRLNEPRTSNLQDKLLAEVDSLQNQIINLHNVNEDRNQLIQVLDSRDSELRAQHAELQNKLTELQNKKMQVDQLVCQLQNMEEPDEEDTGAQVRKIVTMKDQLSKLKDMLEIVKTTETVMQNTNGSSQEEQELACAICTKAENFLQKDDKCKPQQPQNEVRYDNTGAVNDNRHKQVNKNSTVPGERHAGFGGAKPRISNSNKMVLHAELEAKKRELEEIMGKHKAGTSNLNHDVGNDNKSEFSCSSNVFLDGTPGWAPHSCEHNRFDSSERYSSDECPDDVNDYSDLNSHHNQSFTLPLLQYPRPKPDKRRSVQSSEYVHAPESDRLSTLARTPERNIRSNSVTASGGRERPRSNNEQVNKTQVQKQLELIRSVCDSMLEQQQPTNNQPSNVQQLRNNLTPSPLYSEPRRFTSSPNPHSLNALNVVNPIMETPWFPVNNSQANNQNDGNYQNWLATNTLQTQAFMLNTLNQCCQMLWLQQRELLALRQTVGQMQEGMENPTFDNPSHLASPLQPVPDETARRSNQKANHVAAACSMPNLNQYNVPPSVNVDPSYHNNMQNARLLDPCLNNNGLHNGDAINNSVLHNANINQTMPGQIWNGQALNNQVAPGNRANNYWDNFRSYSRQNLLSTKSNEGFQNAATSLDRSNTERPNPFTLISLSKCNSGSTNGLQENSPRRRPQPSSLRHTENRTNTAVPPDVLNVNVVKPNEVETVNHPRNNANIENESSYQMYLNNAFAYNNETSSNHSNVSEEPIFKDGVSGNARRNEWHEEHDEEQYPKSKLFEELRENVYKEVVTLISANEARPHFLIQLFRDLQMISSDPLRLKILQSIQTIITHSLISATHMNRQVLEPQPVVNEQLIPDNFSLQSTVWSKSPKNPAVVARNISQVEVGNAENALKETIPYLNDHEDDIINHHSLISLKKVLLDSESFQETVRDTVFKKHFSNVLDEMLPQFLGKKVRDIKMHIIQTITDLLRGELSFIQLIHDTCPENCGTASAEVLPAGVFEAPSGGLVEGSGAQIQNGDLAEADQSRVDDDETEEEGAVGGFWDQLETPVILPGSPTQVNSEEVDAPTIEYLNNVESQTQFIKQGLDQVPTRLPTKSRSNTPSKDRSTSRSDHPEPF